MMNKEQILGLLFVLLCYFCLSMTGCTGNTDPNSEPTPALFNPNIIWMVDNESVEPENIDSVRITVTATDDVFYLTKTISFDDREASFDDLPKNLKLKIMIEGLDSLGAVIFHGATTIESIDEDSSPEINVNMLAPLTPGDLEVEELNHNNYLIKWQAQSENHLFFEVEKKDLTLHGNSGADEIEPEIDTSYISEFNLFTNWNQVLEYRVRAYNQAGYSEFSEPVNIYGLDSGTAELKILSHTNPDTVNLTVATLYGTASASKGIYEFRINDSLIEVKDGFWQLDGILLELGLNEFNIKIFDQGPVEKTFTEKLRIYYDPDYLSSGNNPPSFLNSIGNLQTSIKSGKTYTRTLSAKDPDEFNIISIEVGPPLNLSDDSIVTWIPALADTGINEVYAIVTDQDGARDSISWEITVLDSRINTAPIIYSKVTDLNKDVIAGETYEVQIIAVDLDDGIDLKYTMTEGDLPLNTGDGRILWETTFDDIGSYDLTVEVEDDSGTVSIITWTLKVVHPSVVEFTAGGDQELSINDVIHLSPSIELKFGTITKYAWSCGDTVNFIEVSDPDTQFTAPATPNGSYPCNFQITLDDGDVIEDEIDISVLLDPPEVSFGEDIFILEGETKSLVSFSSDKYGSVVKWEWKIGEEGTWVEGIDSIDVTMPVGIPSLLCSLIVTDDDSVSSTVVSRVFSINMIDLPGDTFVMGSITNPDGDETRHNVTLSPFKIDVYEISQKEYKNRMGTNPAGFPPSDFYPVESVTWYDAILFCNARSLSYGFDTVYSYVSQEGVIRTGVTFLTELEVDHSKNGFRLPTEAQWEYAVRAGSTSEYFWGDSAAEADSFAVYESNSNLATKETGSLNPNDFELYDLPGNVWEWTNDWYAEYDTNQQNDPLGPETGVVKAIRGGSWKDKPESLRSANREIGAPGWKSKFVGFRTVLPN